MNGLMEENKMSDMCYNERKYRDEYATDFFYFENILSKIMNLRKSRKKKLAWFDGGRE